MDCERALALLTGLTQRRLEARADEIDELIAAGLAVESDVETLWLLGELARLAGEYPAHFDGRQGSPAAAAAAAQQALAEIEKDLKDDWVRFKTSKPKLVAMEHDRACLRRVLGVLADPSVAPRVQKAVNERSLMAYGTAFVPCPEVGAALFAITQRGARVHRDLSVRIERFREAKLGTFLAQFDKAEAKLESFGRQIQELSNQVGYVRKNKAQIVVGLAKTNLPVQQAAGLYAHALSRVQAPDVAVTLARNTTQTRGPADVQRKLAAAYDALVSAGFPRSQVLQGATKTLLPFEPLHLGVARFSELCRRLRQAMADGDDLIRFAARLMPASGEPAQLVQRTTRAAYRLSQAHGAVRARRYELGRVSVALASMAPNDEAVDGLCDRFVAIELALASYRICGPQQAEDLALECVACPGTPTEVASTVGALASRLAQGGAVTQEHLTIAASFAKRFAY